MTLPKIQYPIFDLTIPSSNQNITFRPFLVKEEKILLIAQQSQSEPDIMRAIKQIINNCILEKGFDVDKLTTFDIEYMFLKFRSKSVNNLVKVTYKDNEDQELYDFEIDLDKVEMIVPDSDKKIKINDELGIVLRYPSANIVDVIKSAANEDEILDEFMFSAIEYVYDTENVYPFDENTKDEKKEFLDSLDINTFTKIREFLENLPKLSHTIEYTNKNEKLVKIELSSLSDFFTLG
jgi:hypothetical protein